MDAKKNPFIFAGATELTSDMILDYYIEDFNYSRFIQTKRNTFLVGERGCGKSMALLYNGWPVQRLKAKRDGSPLPLTHIGIYVPCETMINYKEEYQLMGELQASSVSTSLLVLQIARAIAETLNSVVMNCRPCDDKDLRSRFEYVMGIKLPKKAAFFDAVQLFIAKQINDVQAAMNDARGCEAAGEDSSTFASLVLFLLGMTRRIPELRESHFMLLIDDAHALNHYQKASLNSWIAYREHTLFSFKVAMANLPPGSLRTTSGGAILEGHDFTRIDMLQAYQNMASDFGHHAQKVIERRLRQWGIDRTPQEFFPISPGLAADLERAIAEVRAEAIERYGASARKAIADYVYKYHRARYFRNRSPKANRPEYSGFETLTFLSTGVIRNLLTPCFHMYEKVLSLKGDRKEESAPIQEIPPHVQAEAIIGRSEQLWDDLKNSLDQNIEGCSGDDAQHAFQLMDNLATHFRERLHKHKSEPRANSFTISARDPDVEGGLMHILEILQKAQLIYVRSGPAKDEGKREPYYVPNRMLWPARGLDPHGQHARVSLQASVLWAAAKDNKAIPMKDDDYPELFDE